MLDEHRDFYASLVCAKGGTTSEALRKAFATVDRSEHAGPGPWKIFAGSGYVQTPSDNPEFLYQDVLVELAPDRHINNGEPSLHARCIDAVAPAPGEHILHVGAGTGYYSRILGEVVGPSGNVDAFEIEPDLAARAETICAPHANICIHARSGLGPGLPLADVIYVNAGATHVPLEWLDALNLGARLIFPLSGAHGAGAMLMVTRTSSSAYAARFICPAMFIPCIGAQDESAAAAASAAFATGEMASVRSLTRSNAPSETAILSGDGWSLESREP